MSPTDAKIIIRDGYLLSGMIDKELVIDLIEYLWDAEDRGGIWVNVNIRKFEFKFVQKA